MTVEERLRQGLAQMAAAAPVSDDGWERLEERLARRRHRRPWRWAAGVGVPVAAAVAVIALLLAGPGRETGRRVETGPAEERPSPEWSLAPWPGGWRPVDYAGVRVFAPPGWRVVVVEGGAWCRGGEEPGFVVLGSPDPGVRCPHVAAHPPYVWLRPLASGESTRRMEEFVLSGLRALRSAPDATGVERLALPDLNLAIETEHASARAVLETIRPSPTVAVPMAEVPDGVTHHVVEGVPLFLVRDGSEVAAVLDRSETWPSELEWCEAGNAFLSRSPAAYDRSGRPLGGASRRHLSTVEARVETGRIVVNFARLRLGRPELVEAPMPEAVLKGCLPPLPEPPPPEPTVSFPADVPMTGDQECRRPVTDPDRPRLDPVGQPTDGVRIDHVEVTEVVPTELVVRFTGSAFPVVSAASGERWVVIELSGVREHPDDFSVETAHARPVPVSLCDDSAWGYALAFDRPVEGVRHLGAVPNEVRIGVTLAS